jgi:membrane protease YdiL (CAAX protease family)
VAAVAAVALALGGRGLSGPPVPTIDEVPGTPVFAGAGWVVVGWMLTVVVLSLAISAKVPSARARLLTAFSRLGDGWALYPRSTRGAVWWVAVSLTAGCCEELVYRRLLPDLVTRLAGDGLLAPWVLSSLAFGLAHRSQGMRGMLVTGVLGAALFLLVAVTGTLWPAVAVHTIFDLRVVLNFALLGLVPPVPPVPTDRPAG